MSARMGLHVALSLRLDAVEAYRLANEYRAEVLHETPLFLAEYDSVKTEVHLTLDDARACCDDIAQAVANGQCWDWSRNEDGVYVQYWSHEDDDRPLHMTGGTVTEVRVQRQAAEQGEKATATAATATPQPDDFFQPGHTYIDSESPQRGWKFRCDTVTTHPENSERTALGWRFFNGKWEPYAYHEDDWDVAQHVGTTEPSEKCGNCRRPFDPTDTTFDGAAQHGLTPYCRSCVDRCHDSEIADHRCIVCREGGDAR